MHQKTTDYRRLFGKGDWSDKNNSSDHKNWCAKIYGHYQVANLTQAEGDVLCALPTFQGPEGLFPSYAAIAKRACRSVRTVGRALTLAKRLGLLVVLPRRKKEGGRWVRTSNSYILDLGEKPINPGLRPVPAKRPCLGHGGSVKPNYRKKEALEIFKQAATGMPDLLARRRVQLDAIRREEMRRKYGP